MINLTQDPEVFQGGKYEDARGILTYFNDFSLEKIKRFYIIEHPSADIVRAWLGHRVENKWFHIVRGGFKFVLVKPDDWGLPSKELECQQFDLDVINNQVLHVPGGHIYGFKAVVPDSKMIIFSDFSVEESIADDYRYDKNLWYKW